MTAKEQHIELMTGITISTWNENSDQLSLICLFQKVSEQRKTFRENCDKKIEWFTIDGNKRIEQEFKKDFPRKKFKWNNLKTSEKASKYHDKFVKLIKKISERNAKKIYEFDKQLKELAQKITVPKTEKMNVIDIVYSGAWASQGLGEMRYCQNYVDQKISIYNSHGMTCEKVLVSSGTTRDGCATGTYHILVNTDELGMSVLRLKNNPSFALMIQGIMKRGGNPRVFYPFLDYDFESKIGLDHFGNVVDVEKFNRACEQSKQS